MNLAGLRAGFDTPNATKYNAAFMKPVARQLTFPVAATLLALSALPAYFFTPIGVGGLSGEWRRMPDPPLRERRKDVPLLAEHFLKVCRHGRGLAPLSIAPDAMNWLGAYDWPGNVRELENVIRRGAVLCQGQVLGTEDLPKHLLQPAPDNIPSPRSLEDAERLHIADILREAEGNISYASRILQISRPTLRSKIEKYGIDL